MTDMSSPSGLAWQLWTLMVTKPPLSQNGNSPMLLLCTLHGTHSAVSVFYCSFRHRAETFLTWSVFFCNWFFFGQKKLFCSGSSGHLLSISEHCIPVGSQHILIRRQGHNICFLDGNFRLSVTCLLSDSKLAGVGTWGHSPKFQAGVWAACPDSVLSFVAVLIPSVCQLYQPVLRGYLCCCQFSCLNWESFNAGDWDSREEEFEVSQTMVWFCPKTVF